MIRNRLLYLLALLLACSCVVGGVLVYREHADRADTRAEQERYGDVLAAADAQTEAFINIDYREAQASIDKVVKGATGEFKDQYTQSVDSVIEVLEQNQSVMDGKVVWSGVVTLDPDSARVIVATTGTVANVSTQNKPVQRNFRVQLDLKLVKGTWLTSNLEFVG